jgi:hypothetical protein
VSLGSTVGVPDIELMSSASRRCLSGMTSLVLFLIAVGRVSDLWFFAIRRNLCGVFLHAIIVQDITVGGALLI